MMGRRQQPHSADMVRAKAQPLSTPYMVDDGGSDRLEFPVGRLRPMWAKITGQEASTNRYSWEQVNEGETPTFDSTLAEDFSAAGGTATDEAPAYEVNGNAAVPIDTRVLVWPAGDLTYYLFEFFGGSPATTPPPAAPTALTATPTGTSGEVTLQYVAPTGAPPAAQYVAQYSTSPTMANPTTFTTTSALSTTVTGLTDGTLYYFGVYALSSGGTIPSAYSNIASATPATQSSYTTAGSSTFTPVYTGNHRIECWGAGGGGGNGLATGGTGGAGGEYSVKVVALTSGVGKTVVVGAAGTAGGGNGGNSTFDTTVVIGTGGSGQSSVGATGGTGDTTRDGGGGGLGDVGGTGGGGGGSAGTAAVGNAGTGGAGGGAGAVAVADGGAGGNAGVGAGNGVAGTAPGGGGGGGGGSGNGAVGTVGKVRITWPV